MGFVFDVGFVFTGVGFEVGYSVVVWLVVICLFWFWLLLLFVVLIGLLILFVVFWGIGVGVCSLMVGLYLLGLFVGLFGLFYMFSCFILGLCSFCFCFDFGWVIWLLVDVYLMV